MTSPEITDAMVEAAVAGYEAKCIEEGVPSLHDALRAALSAAPVQQAAPSGEGE